MIRPSTRILQTLIGAALLVSALSISSMPVQAADHALPGMCIGRSDPNTSVLAIANGRGHPTKVILAVATDAAGVPTGSLTIGQGRARIVVTDWCRVWQHVPGTPREGSCEHSDVDSNAVTAHAVGQALLSDGRRATVRADVRIADDGPLFRIRYRVEQTHGAHDTTDACDGGWSRIPAEGWSPLRHLTIRPMTSG